jgi:hypothetical protein
MVGQELRPLAFRRTFGIARANSISRKRRTVSDESARTRRERRSVKVGSGEKAEFIGYK